MRQRYTSSILTITQPQPDARQVSQTHLSTAKQTTHMLSTQYRVSDERYKNSFLCYYIWSYQSNVKDKKIHMFKGRLSQISMVYSYSIARDIHNEEVRPVYHCMVKWNYDWLCRSYLLRIWVRCNAYVVSLDSRASHTAPVDNCNCDPGWHWEQEPYVIAH